MKKHLLGLSFGVAAFALSSGAYAQSTGGNQAYTSQNGTGGAQNTIDLSQNSTTGFGDLVTDGSGGGGNKIGTDAGNPFKQDGAGNRLVISQSGSKDLFGSQGSYQVGSNNTANVTQAGFDSRVELRQNGDSNGVNSGSNSQGLPGATNVINQSGPNSLGNNSINLGQTGSYNEFNLQQAGYNNSQIINQNGVANQAATNQTNSTNGSSITINQTHDHNYAFMTQDNAIGGAPGVYSGYVPSSINVSQDGYYNAATGTQSGAQNVMGLTQQGIYNTITATQGGSGNTQTVGQYGNYNTANVYQDGATNSSQITLNQYSSNNTADLRQFGTTTSSITGYQNGTNNQAVVYQAGLNQVSNFAQTGNNNNLVSRQR